MPCSCWRLLPSQGKVIVPSPRLLWLLSLHRLREWLGLHRLSMGEKGDFAARMLAADGTR